MVEKSIRIKYPVKLGYNDGSGKNENIISDSNNNKVVGGWGDCCKIGGIRHRNIALNIINSLNILKPIFRVYYFVDEKETNRDEI